MQLIHGLEQWEWHASIESSDLAVLHTGLCDLASPVVTERKVGVSSTTVK